MENLKEKKEKLVRILKPFVMKRMANCLDKMKMALLDDDKVIEKFPSHEVYYIRKNKWEKIPIFNMETFKRSLNLNVDDIQFMIIQAFRYIIEETEDPIKKLVLSAFEELYVSNDPNVDIDQFTIIFERLLDSIEE